MNSMLVYLISFNTLRPYLINSPFSVIFFCKRYERARKKNKNMRKNKDFVSMIHMEEPYKFLVYWYYK